MGFNQYTDQKFILDHGDCVHAMSTPRRIRNGVRLPGHGGSTRLVISDSSPTTDPKNPDCVFAIRFHYSEIVRYSRTGYSVCLHGYNTPSTKRRIDAYTRHTKFWSEKGDLKIRARMGEGSSLYMLASDTDWYHFNNDGHLVDQTTGEKIQVYDECKLTIRNVGKHRNPVMRPLVGDVFTDLTDGTDWIVLPCSTRTWALTRYHGDVPGRMGWARVTAQYREVTDPTYVPILLVTMQYRSRYEQGKK